MPTSKTRKVFDSYSVKTHIIHLQSKAMFKKIVKKIVKKEIINDYVSNGKIYFFIKATLF